MTERITETFRNKRAIKPEITVGDYTFQIHDGSPLLNYANTDSWNAVRLFDLFGDRIRYCRPLGWLVYNGH